VRFRARDRLSSHRPHQSIHHALGAAFTTHCKRDPRLRSRTLRQSGQEDSIERNYKPTEQIERASKGPGMAKSVDDRGRGARLARRDEGAYCWYLTEEQRSRPGTSGWIDPGSRGRSQIWVGRAHPFQKQSPTSDIALLVTRDAMREMPDEVAVRARQSKQTAVRFRTLFCFLQPMVGARRGTACHCPGRARRCPLPRRQPSNAATGAGRTHATQPTNPSSTGSASDGSAFCTIGRHARISPSDALGRPRATESRPGKTQPSCAKK